MRKLLSLVLPLVALWACNDICPAGHEPGADPAGQACVTNNDCLVECVCTDPSPAGDGEEESVRAGTCLNSVCVSGEEACRSSCGVERFTGEFCAN